MLTNGVDYQGALDRAIEEINSRIEKSMSTVDPIPTTLYFRRSDFDMLGLTNEEALAVINRVLDNANKRS